MNLAIEYLLRNKSIRDFLKTPCSLFLENDSKTTKAVVVLRDSNQNNCFFQVEKFILGSITSNTAFEESTYTINKKEIFDVGKVLIDGFLPILYNEQAINVENNSYNHPMSDDCYEEYFVNFLNSKSHQIFKKDWLWDSFTSAYLADGIVNKKMFLPILERRFVIEREKRHVKSNRPYHWGLWNKWMSKLIFEEEASTELIFWSCCF